MLSAVATEEGGGNRVATKYRNRIRMPAVAFRVRQEAASARQRAHERRQRGRKREASEKRQQGWRSCSKDAEAVWR